VTSLLFQKKYIFIGFAITSLPLCWNSNELVANNRGTAQLVSGCATTILSQYFYLVKYFWD